MDGIRYFRASSADIETVVDLRLEVLAIFKGIQPPELVAAVRPKLYETMAQGLKAETYICWLAEAGCEIIGSGGMAVNWRPGNFINPGGKSGYIMSMYTKPAHRSKGICSELVRRLIGSGKELGIEHFELHATKAGEPVYQKLGFLLHNEPTYRKSEAANSTI